MREPAIGSSVGLRIVQLDGPIRDGWVRALQSEGLEVLEYLPHHAYLVWDSGDGIVRAKRSLPVRFSGPLRGVYKLARGIDPASGAALRLQATVATAVPLEETLRAMSTLGAEVARHHPAQPDDRLHDVLLELPSSRLDELAQLPAVVWIGRWPEGPGLGGEMSSATVAGHLDGGRPLLGYSRWLTDHGLTGEGVRWAVVDSGVDRLHPDLNVAVGVSYPDCEAEIPGDDPDGVDHGTPVAGIIAGTAAAGFADDEGFLYGLGVAPGLELVSQSAICQGTVWWPPEGGWQRLSADSLAAGAVGSNNSWNSQEGFAHGYQAGERTHDLMVRDGDFSTPGVAEPLIMVFNIGNKGPAEQTIMAPKEAKNLLLVGATETWRSSGDHDTVAEFSSRGPTVDGRLGPAVVAPGVQVGAANHRDGGIYGVYEIPGTDGYYMLFEGTSAAAPHVSGVAALLVRWWRARHRGATPSPAMVRALVVSGAVPMVNEGPVPDVHQGWGRVDLGRIVAPEAAVVARDQEAVLEGTGATWRLDLEVDDPSRPLSVTLAWTDAPGALGANPALVNDLDLEVTTGGGRYLGNVFADGRSVTGGAADRLNNLENVVISRPGDTVEVTVTAAHIPGDGIPYRGDATDQDFALVCRNCREPMLPPRRPRGRLAAAKAPVITAEVPDAMSVAPPVQVNVDGLGRNIIGDAANEPSLTVDPTAPNRMLMVWRQFDDIGSERRTAGWATSTDGGRGWTFHGSIQPGVFRTDPVVAADGTGTFYALGLDETLLGCDLFRSFDGGLTWSEPVYAWGGDKPWMVADPERGHLYVAWSDSLSCCGPRTFASSIDGGETFSDPIEISPMPEWGSMALGPEGEVYISGILDLETFGVATVLDAANPLLAPIVLVAEVDMGGIFPFLADPNPQGLPGQPWVAVDRSGGPFHGAVYVLATVDPPGSDPCDVVVARSDDGGASFSNSRTVHPSGSETWQWFGAMDIAPTGRLDVVWIEAEARDQPNQGRYRYAASHDGGITWSAPLDLTPVFDSHIGSPERQRLGDYVQLVSDATGAHLALAATFNGEQDVYSVRIGPRDCDGDGISDLDELAAGAPDCDRDTIPDGCQLAAGDANDDDGDGVLDHCAERSPRRAGGRRRPSSTGTRGSTPSKEHWVSPIWAQPGDG